MPWSSCARVRAGASAAAAVSSRPVLAPLIWPPALWTALWTRLALPTAGRLVKFGKFAGCRVRYRKGLTFSKTTRVKSRKVFKISLFGQSSTVILSEKTMSTFFPKSLEIYWLLPANEWFSDHWLFARITINSWYWIKFAKHIFGTGPLQCYIIVEILCSPPPLSRPRSRCSHDLDTVLICSNVVELGVHPSAAGHSSTIKGCDAVTPASKLAW